VKGLGGTTTNLDNVSPEPKPIDNATYPQ
jgi:hypothetical protein